MIYIKLKKNIYKKKDKSVLEYHHVSAAYALALEEETNIFVNFNREDFTKLRERIICMVLSTDMSVHFSELAKMKGRLASGIFIFLLLIKINYENLNCNCYRF